MTVKTRQHTLTRSGIVVTIPDDWTVADTQYAQRHGKGDGPKTNMALIQRTCRFSGETWTLGDIEEKLGGKDYMELLGELFGGDDDAADGEGSGDDAGNA